MAESFTLFSHINQLSFGGNCLHQDLTEAEGKIAFRNQRGHEELTGKVATASVRVSVTERLHLHPPARPASSSALIKNSDNTLQNSGQSLAVCNVQLEK